jgi:drug/metabolite transporter (DMT)-like permease
MKLAKLPVRGVAAAFLTPLFLGVAPIFGKLAINAGADSFTVAAWRTVISVLLLWIMYALFMPKYIYIYPAGLLGCVVIGAVNGIGSLFYYGGLRSLDASLSQLLNGTYLIFVVVLAHFGGERLDARTIIRIVLATIALLILTGFGNKPINWLGVGLMLANAIMFAGTVILSQYVLYEMPAPTVALYTLTTMAILVTMVWVAVGKPLLTPGVLDVLLPFNENGLTRWVKHAISLSPLQAALPPIFVLGITTALSRLSLFAGVKFMGSLQTAVLALTEIGVALTLAFFVLGDRLTSAQVVGVGILMVSILLIRSKDMLPRGINPTRLISNIADLQYQWIAFEQAFGREKGDIVDTSAEIKLTTAEMSAIMHMMGAERGAVVPIPVKRESAHNASSETNNPQPGPSEPPPAPSDTP